MSYVFMQASDAVIVQLPYAGYLLRDAFRAIGEALKDFAVSPLQSMDSVAMAVVQ